jgi:RimJ/RimL family protein N-acetyltransferase
MIDEPDACALRNLLRGDRVRLTAMHRADLVTVARWYEDDTFLRLYDALPAHPKTEAELSGWLETTRKADNHVLFAVRGIGNDGLVGFVEFDGILWNHGVSGVGACIGDVTERGQGCGSEAMQLALGFAFDELNLHHVVATIFAYNADSIELVERLGFLHEGTLRQHIHRNGRRYDVLLYGLLRHEWQARRARQPALFEQG